MFALIAVWRSRSVRSSKASLGRQHSLRQDSIKLSIDIKVPPPYSKIIGTIKGRISAVLVLRTFAPIATAHLSCARYVPRHVFQSRAPSRNSIKYRAGDLCGNLICEYFCWIIGDPNFFFGRSLPFLILSIILKNKKNLCVGSFNYFLYTIQIGSNWYMDTGMRDLEVACF